MGADGPQAHRVRDSTIASDWLLPRRRSAAASPLRGPMASPYRLRQANGTLTLIPASVEQVHIDLIKLRLGGLAISLGSLAAFGAFRPGQPSTKPGNLPI